MPPGRSTIRQRPDPCLRSGLCRFIHLLRDLSKALIRIQVNTDLYLCGMMTQNCITHTALSPDARRYTVHVLADCCSAPSALIHDIAVRALKGRLDVRETLATGPHAHAID
ncbi:MAG: isochorismatase family protein [Lautropia sp.]|nr:MAG: isochorismatase family protein [Lautropia sp.]